MFTPRNPRIVVLIAAVIALLGCGDKFRREKQIDTEVVSESSTSGVTSTILAPGEAPPPLAGTAPLTGTNADTTTAFTILDSGVPPSSTVDPGRSLAGTLPLPGSSDPVSGPPVLPTPSPRPPVESTISIERSTPDTTTAPAPPAAATETVAPPSSDSAPIQPAPESESTEEEPSSEPVPPPPPPGNTSTSSVSDQE